MTLMELVIGLAITGMMATVGATAFTSIIDHRRVIREASVATERGAALRETIRSWVVSGNIRIQLGGGPRGLTRSAARNDGGFVNGVRVAPDQIATAAGDEITIVTSAPNPSMQPNVAIRLYVDADPSTPEAGLAIEYRPNLQQPTQRKLLDPDIDSLKVEYLDGRTNRWLPASEGATISQLLAIRLTFVQKPEAPPSPILSVPMIFTTNLQRTVQGPGLPAFQR